MRPLSELPTWDPEIGDLTMVIETPQGSRNKYSYDPDTGAFDLGWVLPPGLSFPYDFDFIPSTIAEDGDALDVLVLLDVPVAVGCVVAGRVIGAIQAKQRAPGGKWIRNDRLLAVAKHAHLHQHVKIARRPPAAYGRGDRGVLHRLQPDARAGLQAARDLRSEEVTQAD